MRHGLLYECQRSLIESWWIRLEEHGLTIELKSSPSLEVLPERDGVRYRSGSVRDGIATVDIIACPGPFSPSGSPLSGKHLLLVDFRKSSQNDSQLALIVGDILLELGATEVRMSRK